MEYLDSSVSRTYTDYGEGVDSKELSLLSYTLRFVSLVDLGRLYQFGLRQPIHLCPYVSEEKGDGEGVGSEALSLLSYTLRYVSHKDSDQQNKKG